MKKILVTGGSGFIGTSLIRHLVKEGYKVVCFDFKKPKLKEFSDKSFTYYKGNIFDKRKIENAMSDCQVVIHLAASLGVQNTDENILNCLNANILGTKKVLEASYKKNRRFIFASSSEIYGEQTKFPIREDATPNIKSVYGLSKITAEKYVIGFNQKFNLNYNIIRFFNVYGFGQEKNFVISKFAENIKKRKSIKVYGSGDQLRCFCNVDDAANGVVEVIKKGKKNKIYNIGNNNEPITISNLAAKMIKISKKRINIKKISFMQSDRSEKREIYKRFPDLKNLTKDTNYRARVNLDFGIKEYFRKLKII